MDEATRLRMRRGHLKHVIHCTCGKTVHGNGGKAAHRAMHQRKGDGHFSLTTDALAALQARNEYPCTVPPSKDYLCRITKEDEEARKFGKGQSNGIGVEALPELFPVQCFRCGEFMDDDPDAEEGELCCKCETEDMKHTQV